MHKKQLQLFFTVKQVIQTQIKLLEFVHHPTLSWQPVGVRFFFYFFFKQTKKNELARLVMLVRAYADTVFSTDTLLPCALVYLTKFKHED